MSNYSKLTYHPETGKAEMAHWIDDYFGRCKYGVKFSDGNVYQPDLVIIAEFPLSIGYPIKYRRG